MQETDDFKAELRHFVCTSVNPPTNDLIWPSSKNVSPRRLVRRLYPCGTISWYGFSDRDATQDDVISGKGCLFFEIGLFMGIWDGLFTDPAQIGDFRKFACQRVKSKYYREGVLVPGLFPDQWTPPLEIIRLILLADTKITDDDMQNWRRRCEQFAIAPHENFVPATQLKATDFSYADVFKNNLFPFHFDDFYQKCFGGSLSDSGQHYFFLGICTKRVLPTEEWREAALLGRSVGHFVWGKRVYIEAALEGKFGHIHAAKKLLQDPHLLLEAGWHVRRIRQALSAISFLDELHPDDYLTFTESTAMPDGLAWDGCPPPQFDNPLILKHNLTGPTGVGRRGRKPSIDDDVADLILEFIAKNPRVTKAKLGEALFDRFPTLRRFVTDDGLAYFKRTKLTGRAVSPRSSEKGETNHPRPANG